MSYESSSLQLNVSYLYSSNRKFQKTINFNHPKEHAGFESGFSTMDQLQTVKQAKEKPNEHRKPLYQAFIEYNEAFDHVETEAVLTRYKKWAQSKYIALGFLKTFKYRTAIHERYIGFEDLNKKGRQAEQYDTN